MLSGSGHHHPPPPYAAAADAPDEVVVKYVNTISSEINIVYHTSLWQFVLVVLKVVL